MSDKSKTLTPMQEDFLDHMVGDAKGDWKKAAKLAGYTDNIRFKDLVPPLKEAIIERTVLSLAVNGPKAAYGLINALDDPSAMGARNSIAAAKEILDRIGVSKKDVIEIKGPQGGMFILPPKEEMKEDID